MGTSKRVTLSRARLAGAYRFPAVALVLTIALISSTPSAAQVVSATLTGTVTDSSGASVPDAAVTATETSTGVSRTIRTNGEGIYSLPFLGPGTYRVTIEKQGFKKFEQSNFALDLSTVGRINAMLIPGSLQETVEVTAEAPLLQTENSEVAKNFEPISMTELPLPDRNPQTLAGLVAGVSQPQLYSSGSGILENGSFSYFFNANGQPLGANNTLVDGIDNVDMALGLSLYQPAAEDVAEVHVTTNAYSAEFGRVGGAVVNIVTRGGTNDFHGTLFEFNKTAALAARNLFNPAPQPKPSLTNNDFGAAGGGRIIRNKTFFYASYEGRRNRSNTTSTSTTAQPAWLNGDFSAVPGLKLYDPNSGNPDGTGRIPVSGNILPPSEISAISKKLLPYIPAPNLATAGAALFTLNYVNQSPIQYNSNAFDGRIDHNFSDKAKGYVKFDAMPTHVYEGSFYHTGVGNDLVSDGYNITAALNFTYVFSPSLVAEARGNVNRWHANVACTNTVTNQALGIADPNPDQISTQSMAAIGGIGIAGFGQTYSCPTIDNDTVFPFSTSWTKSKGRHSLKWGGEFTRYRNDRFQVQGSGGFGGRGTFTFGPTITQLFTPGVGGSPLGAYGSTVNAFADFLFGLPDQTDRAQIILSPTMRQSHVGAYIQDDYKLTSRLTINLGFRYDFYEAVKVRYPGGASNYDPNTNSLLIAGYGNIGLSDGVTSKPGYIAPRLGIAYSLGRKTAIRAGYGISYWEERFGFTGGTLNQQYPVIYNVQVGNTGDYKVDGSFSTIPPVTYFSVPANGILNPAPNQAFYTMPTDFHLPAVYNWNFTLQHQITPTLVVDAGWVGNQGRNLAYAYNINQGVPGAGPNAAVLNVKYGRTASTTVRGYGVNSSYNSLQVNAMKRWSKGFHVTLAYAFAKSLDANGENGGFLDPLNYKRTWGPSSFDQTHLVTINHVYELPFGKGQRMFNNGGIMGAILGHWQLSGVFRHASGTPFTPTAPATNCNCAGGSAYADVTGTPVYPGLQGPGQLWVSPSTFALPAVNTHGNAGRDILRGPGWTSYDGNVVRKFAIRERTTLEFRMEAQNVFNHPHFGNPAATVGNATFGQITSSSGERQAQVGLRLTF